MNEALEQQNFPDPSYVSSTYASSPQAVIERPGNPYYQDGVDVGYTAPAKWWNWLWNHISAWLAASKKDREDVHLELQNLLWGAHITPSSSDNHQVSKAVDKGCYRICDSYDGNNVPVVRGYTLYIPDTELL